MTMNLLLALSLCLVFVNFIVDVFAQNDVTCRGLNNEPVDWFYVFKHPMKHNVERRQRRHHRHRHHPYVDKYLYITSDQPDMGWQISESNINETDTILARTIIPVLDDESKVLLAYNDEYPDGRTVKNHGHTKGVIAAGNQTGFWLIHSLPKYPRTDYYQYTSTREYGQSFLCITLNSSQLETVGRVQMFNEPNFYSSRIPQQLNDLYPNLKEASEKNWIKQAPYWFVDEIVSRGGTKFRVFAKGPKFDKELYEDLVAPNLKAELFVQTWRNGVGPLPTNCTAKFHVINIRNLKWPDYEINYPTSDDHSKWAVTNQHDANWICIGDINRMQHQLVRGGGTVCQDNESVARAFRDAITNVESCPTAIQIF